MQYGSGTGWYRSDQSAFCALAPLHDAGKLSDVALKQHERVIRALPSERGRDQGSTGSLQRAQ